MTFLNEGQVKAANEFNDYFKVVNDNVKVYQNTKKGLVAVGSLTNGQVYKRKANQTYWHVIEFGDNVGLVKKSDTEPSTGNTIKNHIGSLTQKDLEITILQEAIVVDSKSGYTQFGSISQGMTFPVVVSQANWWGVNLSGRLGFIPKSTAMAKFYSSDKYFKVTGPTDVYINTSKGLTKFASLTIGQVYPRVGDRTNWHLIKIGNQVAYVKKRETEPVSSHSINNLLTTTKTTGRKLVFLEETEVLDTKSGYAPFGKVAPGTEYPIVISQSNWWGINFGGRLGFVPKYTAAAQFVPSDKYFKVTSGQADVYHNTSNGLVKVGELVKGQEFNRVDEQKYYHLVEFGDQVGFVKKTDTEPSTGGSIKNAQTNTGTTKRITMFTDALVYDTSSGQYIPYAKLVPGSSYRVVFEQKNWWGINIAGRRGIVSKNAASNILVETSNYNLDFTRMVDVQMGANPKSDGAGKISAKREDVSYYLNPTNFKRGTSSYFQFLLLDSSTNADPNELNIFLEGKGSLDGQGEAFAYAGEKYGVNEIYLIAHTLHETGAGTSYESVLSKGVSTWTKLVPGTCTPVKDSNGKTITMDISPKKVYNMYGIAAYDDCVVNAGAQHAYSKEWFTPGAAIKGGAGFVNNSYFSRGQNTLYKMRWHPAHVESRDTFGPQYATHIAWADIQAKKISNMYAQLNNYFLRFDVPNYKNQLQDNNVNPPEEDAPSQPISFPVNTVGKVMIDLNLRSGNSTSNDIIQVLKAGTRVDVIGLDNGWLRIKIPGTNTEGWVSKGNSTTVYVEINNLLQVNTEGTNLNVRETASASGNKLGSLDNGTLVSAKLDEKYNFITVEKDGYTWYEVYFNGTTAYVADFVSIIK
ncbi:SH3 domain-containing protein [Metabacillus litoralis]|uniref:SH3 domain-containing protein n=1 Tax=Metabacillus litoralis TaxID=152268 RepID=UPI001CFCA835|nr:SH3 domain-containing protein [Metabacillus litoralis]